MPEYKAGDRVMVDSTNLISDGRGWMSAGTVVDPAPDQLGIYVVVDDSSLLDATDYESPSGNITCYYAYPRELSPLVEECATEATPAEPSPEDLVRAHILRIANSYADEVIASGRKVVGFEMQSDYFGNTILTINAQKR